MKSHISICKRLGCKGEICVNEVLEAKAQSMFTKAIRNTELVVYFNVGRRTTSLKMVVCHWCYLKHGLG